MRLSSWLFGSSRLSTLGHLNFTWGTVTHLSAQLEVRHSEYVQDLQLVGGCLGEPDGRVFMLTGYDAQEILLFVS